MLEEMQDREGDGERADALLLQLWLREGARAQEQTDTDAGRIRRAGKGATGSVHHLNHPKVQPSCSRAALVPPALRCSPVAGNDAGVELLHRDRLPAGALLGPQRARRRQRCGEHFWRLIHLLGLHFPLFVILHTFVHQLGRLRVPGCARGRTRMGGECQAASAGSQCSHPTDGRQVARQEVELSS